MSGRERVLRHQTELGGSTAGSGRSARLDPLTLPIRFTAQDAVADEQVRHVELHSERVIMRRAVQGMRIALNLPLQSYLGVSIRVVAEQHDTPAGIAVFLEHRDPALAIELYAADNADEVVAEWNSWSRALDVPMLVADAEGRLAEQSPRLGAVRVSAPSQRRRRRNALHRRRPKFLVRRKPGVMRGAAQVHRDEREIIARN